MQTAPPAAAGQIEAVLADAGRRSAGPSRPDRAGQEGADLAHGERPFRGFNGIFPNFDKQDAEFSHTCIVIFDVW